MFTPVPTYKDKADSVAATLQVRFPDSEVIVQAGVVSAELENGGFDLADVLYVMCRNGSKEWGAFYAVDAMEDRGEVWVTSSVERDYTAAMQRAGVAP